MTGQQGVPNWLGPWVGLLGFAANGDIGDVTMYTNRHGKIVIYPKSPPKKPPSPMQVQQRAKFRAAQAGYRALVPSAKAAWELAVKGMHLDMTGQNAFISLSINPDHDAFKRLNAKAGGVLTEPAALPN